MNRKQKTLFLAAGAGITLVALTVLGVLSWVGWRLSAEAPQTAKLDTENATTAKGKPGAVVEVITIARGMTAAAMEKNNTTRIERWLNKIAGVHSIASRSITGASIIEVVFENDVDAVTAVAQVQAVIEADLHRLPPNTQRPVVTLRPPLAAPLWEEANGRRAAGLVMLTSSTLDEAILRTTGRITVRMRLLSVPGVLAPVVLGGDELAVVFALKPAEMEARHVSLMDVKMALHKAHAAAAFGGTVTFGDNQLLLKTNNERGKADEIEKLQKLPIPLEPDNKVYLRDIAVVDSHAPATALVRIDGHRAVCLPIYFATPGDEKARSEQIQKALADLPADLLKDIKASWLPFHLPRKGGGRDEDGLLTLRLRSPSNLHLQAAEKRVAVMERFLQENIPAEERRAIVSEVGVRADLSAAYTTNAGPQDATIRVLLSAKRTHSPGEYVRQLRERFLKEPAFADLRIVFAAGDLPKPFAVRIQGGKPEAALNLARMVRNRAAALKGTTDVFVVERQDAPCLVIDVDQDKIAQLGLTQADILSDVLTAFNSVTSPLLSLQMPIGPVMLLMRSPEGSAATLNDLLNVEVTGTRPRPVKLSSVARFRRTTEAVEIHHVDTAGVLNVRVGVDNRERDEVIADIRQMLRELKVPEGMKVELVNES